MSSLWDQISETDIISQMITVTGFLYGNVRHKGPKQSDHNKRLIILTLITLSRLVETKDLIRNRQYSSSFLTTVLQWTDNGPYLWRD
jgi:hypothetical protein